MKYHPPFGSTDPDAPYVDKNVPGAVRGSPVPAAAVEAPQREIVDFITKAGLTPGNILQLAAAVQSGKVNFASAAGTANAITATLSPVPESLTTGMRILLDVTSANTSAAVTLNVNGLGEKTVYRRNANSLASGDIKPGINEFIYDGTNFRLAAPAFVASEVSVNGFVDLPGGITIQWGQAGTTAGVATVTYPKAFSAPAWAAVAADAAAGSWSTSNASFIGSGISTSTATQVGFRSVTWQGSGFALANTGFSWVAIGPT